MKLYEAPADQSVQAAAKRALYANEYFNGMPAGPATTTPIAYAPVTAADRMSFINAQEASGADGSDDHGELHVYIHSPDGTKVTTRTRSGTTPIKTVTAMTTGWVTN